MTNDPENLPIDPLEPSENEFYDSAFGAMDKILESASEEIEIAPPENPYLRPFDFNYAVIKAFGVPEIFDKDGTQFLLAGVQITIQSGEIMTIDAKYEGWSDANGIQELQRIMKRFELKEKE